MQIGMLVGEVTHHPPVGCRKLHKHFITKNIQRSEGSTKNETNKTKSRQTHRQIGEKHIFSFLLLEQVFVLLNISEFVMISTQDSLVVVDRYKYKDSVSVQL